MTVFEHLLRAPAADPLRVPDIHAAYLWGRTSDRSRT